MTIARRLTLLERLTLGGDSFEVIVPWYPYPDTDEEWEGLPTEDDRARLAAAMDAEGLRFSVVFWAWSVERTLANLRSDRDERRSRGRFELGKGR